MHEGYASGFYLASANIHLIFYFYIVGNAVLRRGSSLLRLIDRKLSVFMIDGGGAA